MAKAAKYWNAIVKHGVDRARRRTRSGMDYIMSDGFPPGTVPMSKKQRAEWLPFAARHLSEMPPEQQSETMKEIDRFVEEP